MKTLAAIAGCFFVAVVLVDGFNTIIVARRTHHVFRPARLFYSLTWKACTFIAKRIGSGRVRESFLGVYGPLSVLTLLALWEIGLMAGFGLIQWGAGMRADGRILQLSDVWFSSATTLLTLGTGNPQNAASRIVSAIEGGVGLAFLGLMISYLPVLYQAYSSRELRITLLDARAGSPPSAAELLVFDSGSLQRLEQHLADWENWSAELLETNISFPMLVFFRSQHINQSWLSALTTILDAAAVVSICGEEEIRTQAELTLAMGRHALVDVAGIFAAKPMHDSLRHVSPDDLETFRGILRESGTQWSPAKLTEEELARARELYEPYAEALSLYLLVALPAWLPDGPKRENWRRASKRRLDAFAVSDPYKLPEE